METALIIFGVFWAFFTLIWFLSALSASNDYSGDMHPLGGIFMPILLIKWSWNAFKEHGLKGWN